MKRKRRAKAAPRRRPAKRNPAKPLKRLNKSTGWMKATSVKIRRNKGKYEVLIRRSKPARRNSSSGAKKAKAYHVERMKKTGRYNTGPILRNVGGYVDADGEFHPIRDSPGYDYAGVIAKKKRAAAKKKRRPAAKMRASKRRR